MRLTGSDALGLLRAHRHGFHGIVALVLLVVIVVVVVVLVRQHRAGRPRGAVGPLGGAVTPRATAAPEPPAPPSVPSVPPLAPAPAAERATSGPPPPRSGPHPAGGAIRARALVKHYGERVALDGLGFDVEPGRVTGFLGPNGAGKSTTMRLILGLDVPDSGTVTVNGRAYRSLAWPIREVGALLEASALHPGRTARAHLLVLARTARLPRTRVEEVLALVGLTEVANQRVGGFSLGMRQRLGIAAALLGDPGVLLFDEPVNGLDAEGIRWVRGLLRRLAAEGRTVFVSSHLMTEMSLMADHLVVIGRGRLIAQCPVAEFTARDAHAYVRVRAPELDRLEAVLEAAGATTGRAEDGALEVRGLTDEQVGAAAFGAEILLHELSVQSASLEDAFLQSTEAELEYRGDRPSMPRSEGDGS